MNDTPSLEQIFHAARELPAGLARDAWLEQACTGDAAMRAKVDALLRASTEATEVFGAADAEPGGERAVAAARDEVAEDLERYKQLRPGSSPSAGAESVLQILRARSDVALGVHLDEPDQEDAPVLVTEEAKQLREPSGRYQMLGELGRGGVGVVYKGRDMDLGRDVAIKVLKDEHARRPDLLARFVEEAQVGGQLQHPGIVPVYELGLNVGEQPFFAMKLVKGETLAAQLAARSEPSEDLRRLLGVFEQICQTMAYAHARRVVHRDLKPANVMIGAFGEVQIVDWGLSKVLPKGGVVDEQASIERDEQLSVIDTVRTGPGAGSESLAGSRIGTPAYMPPEQALGDIDRLDQRSDVFGLGAILCEILSGAPPYRRVNGDVLRQAAMGALDQAFERIRACGADEAMVALCCACLAREPQDRPKDASELAAAMQAYFAATEERAHAARLEAAEARVRVVAERKARRLTLALASSGLALIAVVAGVYVRGVQREEARVAQLRERLDGRRQVVMELQVAGQLGQALVEAQVALDMAEDEGAGEATRAKASALVASVTDAVRRKERQEELLQHLEEVRALDPGRIEETGDKFEELDAAYADAFGSLGLDLDDVGLVESIEELRAAGFGPELALALDDWARLRSVLSRPEEANELTGLALDFDDDERRVAVRQALLDRDVPALVKLAGDEECHADARTLVVLIEGLSQLGESGEARELAGRAARLYPGDYRLRWSAGWSLFRPHDLRSGFSPGAEEKRPDLALPHYAAALALRPDDPAALVMVANAEFELGEIIEARTHLLRTLEMDLYLHRIWKALTQIEFKLGEFESAARHLERATRGPPAPELLVRLATARHLAGELSEDEFDTAIEPFRASVRGAANAWIHISIFHPQRPDASRLEAAWERVEQGERESARDDGYWFSRAVVALRADRPVEALEAVATWVRMDLERKPLDVAALEFVAAMARQRLDQAELARERYDVGRIVLDRFVSGREEQLERSLAACLGDEARVELGL